MSLKWRGRSPFFNLSLWNFYLRSVFKEYGNTFLFPFEKGDCEDYKTWRQADKGFKDTQTQLSDCDLETIKALLENSTHKPDAGLKFTKTRNIFQFDA